MTARTALVNAHLLSLHSDHFPTQVAFQIALYTVLFECFERFARKRKAPERFDVHKAPVDSGGPHVS